MEAVRERFDPGAIVGVRIYWGEVDLGRSLRNAGGAWRRDLGLWLAPYRAVVTLGLRDRIVSPPQAERTRGAAPTSFESPPSNPEHSRPRRPSR